MKSGTWLWLKSEDESICFWLRSISRFGFIVSPGWNSQTLPDYVAIQVTPDQQILTLHLKIRYSPRINMNWLYCVRKCIWCELYWVFSKANKELLFPHPDEGMFLKKNTPAVSKITNPQQPMMGTHNLCHLPFLFHLNAEKLEPFPLSCSAQQSFLFSCSATFITLSPNQALKMTIMETNPLYFWGMISTPSLQPVQDHYGNHYHIHTGHVDVPRAAESGLTSRLGFSLLLSLIMTFHAGRIQFMNRAGRERGQSGGCLICSEFYHR